MAGSVNKVLLIGNLCADPEIKSFANGGRIANLRLATNESWKDKQTSEKKERVEYHSVTITGDGLVGVAEKYLRKGSKVYLEGKLQTRKWQDQNGNDRYSTEIVLQGPQAVLTMLDGPQGNAGNSSRREPDGSRGAPADEWGGSGGWNDPDDDIPFISDRSIF